MLQRLEVILRINAEEAASRSSQKTFSRFENRSGRLRQSINGTVRKQDGKLAMVLRAGGVFGGKDVFYAKFVELGTRKGLRARLFLGRSFAIQKDTMREDLRPLLREALQLRTQ
jgi:hypothetical protein